MRNETGLGLSTNTLRSIAVTLIVMGIAFLAGGLIWDMNGGPSWLHAFTWVGGWAFGYGVVLLVSARRSVLK